MQHLARMGKGFGICHGIKNSELIPIHIGPREILLKPFSFVLNQLNGFKPFSGADVPYGLVQPARDPAIAILIQNLNKAKARFMEKQNQIWQGFVVGLPISIAVGLYGLVMGVLAAAQGISWLELLIKSFAVFAGASQLVVVERWGSPIWVLLVATAAINMRYIMVGLSLRQTLKQASWPLRISASGMRPMKTGRSPWRGGLKIHALGRDFYWALAWRSYYAGKLGGRQAWPLASNSQTLRPRSMP